MSAKALHGPWRTDGGAPLPVDVRLEGDRLVGRVGAHDVDVRVGVGAPGEVVLDLVGEGGATRRVVAQVVRDGTRWLVAVGGRVVAAAPAAAEAGGGDATAPGLAEPFATSPMTGVVTKVFVAPGASVASGAPLVAVEAMKMEYVVRADRDVVVEAVAVAAGDRVSVGDVVVRFA